jgi:transposase
VRLLLDEHLGPSLAEQLRSRGHDVVAIQERIELRGAADAAVIAVAAEESRTVVTRNIRDYVRVHNQRLRPGGHHAGILLVHGRSFPEVRGIAGRLVTALDARLCSGAEIGDTYEYL